MERLKLKYEDAVKALATLNEVTSQPFSKIIRDAAIQRFEYTFEALWKFLKEYLKEKEGIVANSPKACFKELFALNQIDEPTTYKFLEMTDKRNDTSHTYKEAVAQAIYERLSEFGQLISGLLKNLEKGL